MIYKQSQTKTSDKLLTQSIIYFDHLNKNILRFQQFWKTFGIFYIGMLILKAYSLDIFKNPLNYKYEWIQKHSST